MVSVNLRMATHSFPGLREAITSEITASMAP
jgi:hypothetical protein